MTLDDILSKLLDAMEAQNTWDAEAYAQMGLDYVKDGKPLGKINKEIMLYHLNHVFDVAKKQNDAERNKQNLIEEIVNFKG